MKHIILFIISTITILNSYSQNILEDDHFENNTCLTGGNYPFLVGSFDAGKNIKNGFLSVAYTLPVDNTKNTDQVFASAKYHSLQSKINEFDFIQNRFDYSLGFRHTLNAIQAAFSFSINASNYTFQLANSQGLLASGINLYGGNTLTSFGSNEERSLWDFGFSASFTNREFCLGVSGLHLPRSISSLNIPEVFQADLGWNFLDRISGRKTLDTYDAIQNAANYWKYYKGSVTVSLRTPGQIPSVQWNLRTDWVLSKALLGISYGSDFSNKTNTLTSRIGFRKYGENLLGIGLKAADIVFQYDRYTESEFNLKEYTSIKIVLYFNNRLGLSQSGKTLPHPTGLDM